MSYNRDSDEAMGKTLKVYGAAIPQEPVVMCCPKCGSGDTKLCTISVRPYCRECKHWGPINYIGTMQDAINAWNSAAIKAGR